MRLFLILVFSLGALWAISLPEVGSTPPNAVPFETIKEIALRKAQAEWPGCRLGTIIPYVDEEGQTAGYMFHFRTDGKEFPDYDEVVKDIIAEKENLTANTDLTKWRSKYSHLLISARYDRPPIVCYGYGTSEFYAVVPEGLKRAKAVLGEDVYLCRIYFIMPVTFLEFANSSKERVIFTPHFEQTFCSREEFVNHIADLKKKANLDNEEKRLAAEIHQQEWAEALNRDFSKFTAVFVPDADKAPFYDWSYGCTPTAAAMVMGYIDKSQNYGRLVDWFWMRWDMVEGEWDKQIPNVQRECAIRMSTDTTRGATSIPAVAPGLWLVAYDNGYSFEVIQDLGTPANDWAWERIVNEIDDGYAFVWSATWAIHSLAAYGYRTPEKDLYVHNTWWKPAEWWHYSGEDNSHIGSPHPNGADAYKLELLYPLGDTFYNSLGKGETLFIGDTVLVRWDNFGNPADWVAIDISFNAGRTWNFLDSVPDTGVYNWFVSPELPSGDSFRLRLRQYRNGTLMSADGTFGCFKLIRGALPPKHLAPPNGQQLFSPPVVLLVDTTRNDLDSFCFRVVYGAGDTIWRAVTTVPCCSLPDNLFTYGKSYKWFCKGYNRFGWGDFSTSWSFWIRFNPGVEENPSDDGRWPPAASRQPTVWRIGSAPVVLSLSPLVVLEIYDITGEKVRALKPSGSGLVWDFTDNSGRRVPAGLYFIRLLGKGVNGVHKLLLLE
ncbi:MAG: hypothetical protein ABIK39_00060 [candidate division WOR-3 bacterium]